jgi:transcriptional regulator with XRE-family HTH domain
VVAQDAAEMDDLKVGAVVRAVRRRRNLRQRDVAALAGVSQWAVSMVERGQLDRLPVRTIRRIASALEIRMPFEPKWRGGELPRLVDARHAALVEQVVARLASCGWEVTVEYTFSRFGEHGSVDVVGWRGADRALLLIEVKAELDDMQNMLSVLDRKVRLVPSLLAAERGWRATVVGVILVMPDRSTYRDGVARFQATFAAAFPSRNVEIRRWVSQPGPGPLRGTWFLRPSGSSPLMQSRGGPRRIRASLGSDTALGPGPTKREPRTERALRPGQYGTDGRTAPFSVATSRRVSP